MLNIQDIIHRVNNPELCASEDINDLLLMTEKFPYAQLFPILYLKALSNRKDIRFEEELMRFAYRITDRVQLYHLIQKSTITISEHFKTSIPLLSDSESEQGPLDNVVAVNDSDHLKNIESDEKAMEKFVANEITIETNQESESEDVECIPLTIRGKESVTSTDSPSSEMEIKSFEKVMLSETISAAYETAFQNQLIKEEVTDTHRVENASLSTENNSVNIEDNKFDKHEKRSFSSWLKSNSARKESAENEEKIRMDALIEKFIDEEPRITRPVTRVTSIEEKPKKEFYSAAKKAKESIQSTSIPVSETLAHIFTVQGNYPKAIYVYEQLILLNPKKKIYFANKILDLKKKLTN